MRERTIEELMEEIEKLRKQNQSLRTMLCQARQQTLKRTEKRTKILELWHSGKPIKHIAADVGCSLQHAYYTIRRERLIA